VLLTELADRVSPRLRRVVRIWWWLWVASGVMSVISLCWHLADSVQALANGVLVSALTDAVAVAVAVVTLWVIRESEGRDLLGRTHVPKRTVLAFGPARPVIEPIGAHADAARDADLGEDKSGVNTGDEHADTDRPAGVADSDAEKDGACEDEEVLTR
jgi:hypothetical protein